MLLAGCLFALLAVFSRYAYDLGITPFAFVVWRSGVAALFMAGVVAVGLRRGGGRLVGWRSLPPRDRVALFVAALMGSSLDVTMFLAFERVSVAIVLLCFYLFPAMVAAASAALGWEPLDRLKSVALVVALGGMVAVVVGGEGVAGAAIDPLGVVLALGSAASQAVFVLVARRGYRQVPSDQAITFVLAVSTTIAATLALVTGGAGAIVLPFANANLLLVLVVAGVVAAAVPSYLFLAGIRSIGGVRAGILMLVQAPVGVLLAAVFLAEGITLVQVAGGAAILVAAAIIQRGAGSSSSLPPETSAASAPAGG